MRKLSQSKQKKGNNKDQTAINEIGNRKTIGKKKQ